MRLVSGSNCFITLTPFWLFAMTFSRLSLRGDPECQRRIDAAIQPMFHRGVSFEIEIIEQLMGGEIAALPGIACRSARNDNPFVTVLGWLARA